MTGGQKESLIRWAREIGNCDTAITILAASIDTPLADAMCAIGNLLERISADMTDMAETAN